MLPPSPSFPPARERFAGAAGTALVLALIGYGLLAGLRLERPAPIAQTPILIDFARPARPPIPPPPPRKPVKTTSGGSPPAPRGRAAEIAAPPPLVPLVAPPPVIVAPAPDLGMERSTGLADRPGAGLGLGGSGGGWGDGDGPGAGERAPVFVHGRIRYADLPLAMRAAGAAGTLEVRYDVGGDGRVDDCVVIRSSGDAALDDITCRLIEQRFRYRPARDGHGRPVRSTIEQNHSWIVDPAAER